ncbi:hypothetical protein SAMD00019534_001860 [Acytostelium subglobosum LB1]|uniref:hypothetical protein n=1 Tax=Acytostelium subglobosum LB1 TaxID=1410327 RepID=UPI000644E765|nr:hypothetical protein SAMD00019534_001860 [Acytostelium subglobosum LB1]GAM17011.1 hypothetical protein SAMD00019534_001860 [Acytostelium subglobosum LB1]|eukprot:XP_012759073.1 hypothetical protein SAMD00019534_001860 [Acytostelium subglobosum LB1]
MSEYLRDGRHLTKHSLLPWAELTSIKFNMHSMSSWPSAQQTRALYDLYDLLQDSAFQSMVNAPGSLLTHCQVPGAQALHYLLKGGGCTSLTDIDNCDHHM